MDSTRDDDDDGVISTVRNNGYDPTKLLHYLGPHASIVSWDHFFMSLNQYHSSLCQETFGSQEPQQTPAFGYHRNNITPQEVDGLRAVLKLIRVVVEKVGFD